MSNPPNESCYLCRFWDDENPRGDDTGFCRRNAPWMTGSVKHFPGEMAKWPRTQAEDWCGEWVAEFKVQP